MVRSAKQRFDLWLRADLEIKSSLASFRRRSNLRLYRSARRLSASRLFDLAFKFQQIDELLNQRAIG
jgi:hypothetical protein